MKKNMKLVSVLSVSALLAIGASCTVFAAESPKGWQQNNGEWEFKDKDGEKVTDVWRKSGDNWFYLNEDGVIEKDTLVKYNDDYYYVDNAGSMVTNQWVSIDSTNNFYEGDNDEHNPSKFWYYFGTNGKAYKTENNKTSFKTINDKKYAFDNEGKMLYGWVKDGERQTEDNGWKDAEYYLGNENDGFQTIGWIKVMVTDDDWDSDNDTYDNDQERWFYFNSNGKKVVNKDNYKINDKKYGFDSEGRMLYEWVIATQTTASQGTATYSSAYKYFNKPEDGAKVTKGWFKVIADEDLDQKSYDDDKEAWYYTDSDGNLIAGQIKSINGKKYAFDTYGKMLDGLKFVELDSDNKTITEVYDDEDYDDEDEFDGFAENHPTAVTYYFGSTDDGEIKTGIQTVTLDNESFKFAFNKSGSYRGQGKTGIDNNKIYKSGKLMKADKDEKFKVIAINKEDSKTTINYVNTSDFLKDGVYNNSKKRMEYSVLENDENTTYYLVNTSGEIQKSKSNSKDGDEYYFNVKNKVVTDVYIKD